MRSILSFPLLFRLTIGLCLGGLAAWLILRDTNWQELQTDLQSIRWRFLLAGVLVIVATVLSKAERWRRIFPDRSQLPPKPVRQSLILGQFFNSLLPAARLGDVVRIVSLPASVPKGQTLGTLVVEKTLDLLMTALSILAVLPLLVVPDIIQDPQFLLITAAVLLLILYLLAYQARPIITIAKQITGRFPEALGNRLERLIVSGLEGLSSLRSPTQALHLLIWSAWIAVLSLLTPFLMFLAFDIDQSIAVAAVVNAAVLIGSLPSTAPANLGVFELLVVLTLLQFGESDESLLFSMAFVFHMVVLMPNIIWGTLIIIREDRSWIGQIGRVRRLLNPKEA